LSNRGFGPPPLDQPYHVVADHIVRFSLAGIEATRKRAGTNGKAQANDES
jgi:hypothetical protein